MLLWKQLISNKLKQTTDIQCLVMWEISGFYGNIIINNIYPLN